MINAMLDFYDDPTGSVLKKKVPTANAIPEFIKTAERLTRGEMEKLPDDVFALVMLDGDSKMRKYACVDKGNTALSVIYFMENKDFLPEEAQKVAAANLCTACGWYDMLPPDELMLMAGMEKMALVGALMGAATMASGVAEGHKKQQARKQMLAAGVPGSQVMKAGELSGSEPMPYGQDPEKTSALNPYVDVAGKKPPVKVEHETGSRFALVKEGEAHYPIDTAQQVQRAFSYFDRYMDRFTPAERHQYCVKVASRAGELGLRVPKLIEKYGAMTLAPDAHVAIYTRQRLFREGTGEHSLLEEMKTKCAAVKPEVLAVALENFDRQTDLDQMWDNGIPDPYFSVFGKVAEAQYSFVHGNDVINEERLKRCARECKENIEELFGEDVAEEFSKNPVQIFDSLPLDSKRIIMRIGQQVEE
jgi:hypothetical protein